MNASRPGSELAGAGRRGPAWPSAWCTGCDGHGHRGRLALHERMVADDTIRAHIRRREAAAVLQVDAIAAGMTTLRQDGIDKVLAGLTDLS